MPSLRFSWFCAFFVSKGNPFDFYFVYCGVGRCCNILFVLLFLFFLNAQMSLSIRWCTFNMCAKHITICFVSVCFSCIFLSVTLESCTLRSRLHNIYLRVGFNTNYINPFMPSALFYLSSLNRFISNIRGVWLGFIIIMFWRNFWLQCKRWRP